MTSEPAAFWSYSHEDNRADDGRIADLASSLSNEFSLVSGQNLQLFLDSSQIAWGEEWRARINSALAAATFFIPVLTPRYFTRDECRKELLSFHKQAEILGTNDFILPIYYARVLNFGESHDDELVVLASRFQFVDWTDLRLEGPTSPAYRRRVHELATRLIDIGSTMAERQLKLEEELSESGEEPGLAELVDQAVNLLPPWLESLERAQVSLLQIAATNAAYHPRLQRLARANAPASAVFATQDRYFKELEALLDKDPELGRAFFTSTLQLDPIVTQIFDLIQANPWFASMVDEVIDGILTTDFLDGVETIDTAIPAATSMLAFQTSRRGKKLGERIERERRPVTEANQIAVGWRARAAAVRLPSRTAADADNSPRWQYRVPDPDPHGAESGPIPGGSGQVD